MSTLRNQIIQSLEGLSDDSLRFILDVIQRFILPVDHSTVMQKFIADGHDIDECNDEVARLFWVDDG